MGGYFGAVSGRDVVLDVFYGTDYHSHLGTARGGMAAYDEEYGFQREIHNIENSPFRTKFEGVCDTMRGRSLHRLHKRRRPAAHTDTLKSGALCDSYGRSRKKLAGAD